MFGLLSFSNVKFTIQSSPCLGLTAKILFRNDVFGDKPN